MKASSFSHSPGMSDTEAVCIEDGFSDNGDSETTASNTSPVMGRFKSSIYTLFGKKESHKFVPLASSNKKVPLCLSISFLESWDQFFVFFAYIILYLIYGAWVHVTQGITYSPTMMILSVLLTKLTVSIMAYRLIDGSMKQLFSTLFHHRLNLTLFSFPAFAYATTDALGVYCLRRLDPATFAILYNVRVVFMLFLFQYFMKTSLKRPHWIAMGLVILACIIKEVPSLSLFNIDAQTDAVSTAVGDIAAASDVVLTEATLTSTLAPQILPPSRRLNTSSVTELAASLARQNSEAKSGGRIWTVLLLVLMGQLAAFAAVFNEKLLKDQSQLSLNVQNVAMYTWAILASVIFSLLLPLKEKGFRNVLSDLGSSTMWITIWSYPIVIAVMLSAVYGLVTSFFIKRLNNVVREIAGALHIIGTIPVNVFFFSYAVKWTDIAAVTVVILGVAIYNRYPIKPSTTK